jgi:hypothetical protein
MASSEAGLRNGPLGVISAEGRWLRDRAGETGDTGESADMAGTAFGILETVSSSDLDTYWSKKPGSIVLVRDTGRIATYDGSRWLMRTNVGI